MQDQTDFQLITRGPTPTEYQSLCNAVGWGDCINFEAAKLAVPRSLHAVTALSNEQAIGMGRIVGDGAIFFYIQDIAVDPAWQGRGVGKTILLTLVDWVRENAPEKAFLGLFAVKGTESFYEQFGFAIHAGDIGMFQVIPPR